MKSPLILLFLQLLGNVDVSVSQTGCTGVPFIPHASVTAESKKPQYAQGDVIYFTCEIGYTSGPSIKYACTSEGWAALRKGQCTLKPCQLPEDIPNGQYEIIKGEEFVFGTIIRYHCDEGYRIVGRDPTRTCMLNSWSNRVPVCEPMSCDPPIAADGLTIKGLPQNDDPLLPGHFLTFSCDVDGQRVNGSSNLVCGTDGQWDHPFPTCEDITCKVEELASNMRTFNFPANKTAEVGHKIQFYCDNDFLLTGRDEITCLNTGEWDHPFPTCSAGCIVPAVPQNARITIQQTAGDVLHKGQKIKFGCKLRNEFIKGNSEVECLEEGRWSGAFPTCAGPARCVKPPTLVDGDTEGTLKSTYVHNDRVKYICQSLYTMQGGPYKTCNNGQWTGNMRCLKPCTIDEDLMKIRNIGFRYTHQKKLYAPHLDEIEFSCVKGRPVDHTVNMRQQCIDGVMLLPTCQ